MNYAPAFEDTLLGLRLFQLDVLLIDKSLAVGVPKLNGQFVLGAGEVYPSIDDDSLGREAYYFALARYLEGVAEPWSSYVICDCDGRVTFGISDDEFYISGELFFYFWVAAYDRIFDQQAVGLAKRRNILTDSGSIDTLNSVFPELRPDEQAAFYAELSQVIGSLEIENDASYLKIYSEQRNKLNLLLSGMNPNVWTAGTNTMRWSAFFRYVRNEHSSAWESFINDIKTVEIAPSVETPEIMIFGGIR